MATYFTPETPSGWSLLSDSFITKSEGQGTPDPRNGDASSELKVAAVAELGAFLLKKNYEWVCPSRETEMLVNARFVNRYVHNLPGLFGWNRIGSLGTVARLLPATLLEDLVAVGVLQVTDGESVRSRVRFSNVGTTLIAQSAWPVSESDSVMVGPETHQFGLFIERELLKLCAGSATCSQSYSVVDLGFDGGGTGVLAARAMENIVPRKTTRVCFLNTNPRVLRFAEVNARIAKLTQYECRQAEGLDDLPESVGLVFANFSGPSRLRNDSTVTDRAIGRGSALQIVDEFLQHMRPGSSLLLSALAPVMGGTDVLHKGIEARISHWHALHPATVSYQVLETDVYGSKLSQPDFAEVERFMRVGITVRL